MRRTDFPAAHNYALAVASILEQRLPSFPHGWCFLSSAILGRMLLKQGLGDWTIRRAYDTSGQRWHVWLVWKTPASGTVAHTIDITAHQMNRQFTRDGVHLTLEAPILRPGLSPLDRIFRFEPEETPVSALQWDAEAQEIFKDVSRKLPSVRERRNQ